MKQRATISGGLLASILYVFMYAAQVLYLPSALAAENGQSAWVAALLGGLIGMTAPLLGAWVSMRHPGLGPAQIARTVAGKWAGILIGFVYAGFFTWLLSLVLRNIMDFSMIVLLPGTPGRVVATVLVLTGLYAVWQGLEPVARVAFQVVVAVTVGALSIPLLSYREFSILQMEPFLIHGVGSALHSGILASSWFAEGFVVICLAGHLRHPSKAFAWTLLGAIGAILHLAWLVALTVLVFGPDLPGRMIFPVYSMVQMVTAANILERIEIVLVIIWMSAMFVKVCVCLFAAAEAAQQSLGLKTHRGPAVCCTLAAVLLLRVWEGPLDLIEYGASELHQWVHGGIAWGVPMLLLVLSLVRGLVQRGGSRGASL